MENASLGSLAKSRRYQQGLDHAVDNFFGVCLLHSHQFRNMIRIFDAVGQVFCLLPAFSHSVPLNFIVACSAAHCYVQT